jgi:protein CpxP
MKQFTQNKFLVLLVAILLIANLGLMLYFFVFRNDHEGGKRSPRPVSDFVQKELGFNADQTAKFQQLRDQHREAVRPIMDEMKKLKDSLYNLLQNPNTNDSTVTAMANKIGEKQKEWELMIFHHFQKVREICDSSQLPKFDTLVHRMINRGPWMRKKRSQEK